MLDEDPGVVLAHSFEAVIDAAGSVTQARDYPLATDSPRAPERFKSILFGSSGLFESSDPAVRRLVRLDNNGILRCCDMYGVIRTAVLRKVTPLGSFHHPDVVLECALALYGRFRMTPAWLYFRRDSPDRTVNQAPRVRDRCVVHDPSRQNRLLHPTVRLVGEYLCAYVGAIQHAPLSAGDRWECYRALTGWMLDRAESKIIRPQLAPIEDSDHSYTVSVPAIVAGQDKWLVKSAGDQGEQPS
jgi:hypothetical protein